MKTNFLKILPFGLIVFLNYSLLFAQSVTSGPSSASSANIAGNNSPVTLYSGRPNINVPLHIINADGIQIPIELSYDASGIKVDQLASQVGLGWSLNAGGAITREMRGYPDEMDYIGYLSNGSYTNKLFNEPINGVNAVSSSGQSSLPVNDFDFEKGQRESLAKDTESDVYHFNFGGYAGKFVFDADGKPQLLDDNQDLKIEYKIGRLGSSPITPFGMSHIASQSYGLIENFTITTPSGIQYIFAKKEVQMVFNPKDDDGFSYPESPDDRCLGSNAYLDEDLSSHHVSAWYLSSIDNNMTTVTLEYDDAIETNHTISQQLFAAHSELTHQYTVTQVPLIKVINWNGSQNVSFIRNTIRKDFYYPNPILINKKSRALDKIIVASPMNKVFKEIELKYDYFAKAGIGSGGTCTHSPDIIKAHGERLKLLSVKFTENWGNGNEKVFPPYQFEYNEFPLPVRHSNRKDLWGYFNGSQPGSYDLAPALWEYPNDAAHQNTFLSHYSPIRYDSYNGSENLIAGEDRPTGTQAMQAGILKKVKYPTGGYTAYEYEPHEFKTPAHYNFLKGSGLRIKKITRSNGIDELSANAVVKTYDYEDENGAKIPGQLQSWPSFSYIDPFGNTTNFSSVYSTTSGGYFTSSNNQGIVSAANSSNVLYTHVTVRDGGNRGKTTYIYDIPVRFDTERKDLYNGQYVYNRTVSSIYTNHGGKSNSPYAPNPNYSWRVALKETKIFNESNVLLQRTVNEYEIAKAEKLKRVRFRFFHRGFGLNGTSYQPTTNHEYAKYYDISGWYRLKSRTVYSYDETNPSLFVARNIAFGYSVNHKRIVKKEVVNSDGSIYTERNLYPFDYNYSGVSNDPTTLAILKMKKNFINKAPIESITMLKPVGKPNSVIGGRLLKPIILPTSGNVTLGESYNIETQNPIINFNMSSINQFGRFVYNNLHKRQHSAEQYNSRDLPVQVKREYGQPNSLIWQTESPYLLVGRAKNASRSDIGITSFEQATFHDEWDFSINGNNKIVTGGHTGDKHYEMRTTYGASGLFAVSDQNRKYKCSAWVKSTSGVNLVLTSRERRRNGIYPNVASSYQQTNSGNTNGEWKYIEIEIDLAEVQSFNTNASKLDVHFYFWNPNQQLVLIDDVRFGPADAPMQTTVYNEKSQAVAHFDLNSKKTTYEYTASGHLLLHKNEDDDILSANLYSVSNDPLVPSYQKNTRVRNQGLKVEQDVEHLGYSPMHEWSSSVTYFDGLRRPIQQISINGSPNKEDIIRPIKYSNYGQQDKRYLPYADGTGIAGSFRNQSFANQVAFYGYNYQDPNAFSTASFDQSPLNRVKSIRPVSNQFVNHPSNLLSGVVFKTNASGEVFMLDGLQSNGFYPAGSLFVTESQDFKGNKSWKYEDVAGRTIMIKKDVGGGEYAKTYYGYTPKGQLLGIIPPEQTKTLEANNWDMTTLFSLMTPKNQLFLYEYDARGRNKLKWTPESKEEYVYDRLDRLVLSNDLELKNSNKWRFTKYDVLNRPVIQGLYTHNNSNIPSIATFIPLYEKKQAGTTHGYSNVSFPNTGYEVLSVHYFDDYDRTGDGADDVNFSLAFTGNFISGWPGLHRGRVPVYKGLLGYPTMTKTALLDNSGIMLNKATFYNRYGQVIQVAGDNHLGGTDQLDFVTDFEGKIREQRQLHRSNPGGTGLVSLMVTETFNYDHEGRLLGQTHQIGNGSVVTLKANEYGLLGEQTKNKLHQVGSSGFLETLSYQQDLLGRTTSITTSGGTYFRENILYDANSNVVSTSFRMPVRNPLGKVDMCPSCPVVDVYTHSYDFSYDKLNRMTSADHNIQLLFSGRILADQYPGRYSVDQVTYNLNNDLLSLNRNGFLGYIPDPNAPSSNIIANFGSIDELNYTYHQGRLVGVSDLGDANIGFTDFSTGIVNVNNTATHEYQYNDNGHLVKDGNKGINLITYNHLNLATSMQLDGGVKRLDWLYSAGGQKLRKTTTGIVNTHTKDYVGIFEYSDNVLEAIRTVAGRAVPNGIGFSYEYVIKDHQGNNRIAFSDLNNDGAIQINEVLQQNHYYPFGMRMGAIDDRFIGIKNLYQYGGKEKQEDYDLNLLDYGPRHYDPSLGRWQAPDILKEKYHYQSSFAYVSNNPITFSDPTGMDDWRDVNPERNIDRREDELKDEERDDNYENLRGGRDDTNFWSRDEGIQESADFLNFMAENYYEDQGNEDIEPEDPPIWWSSFRLRSDRNGFDIDGIHRLNKVGEYGALYVSNFTFRAGIFSAFSSTGMKPRWRWMSFKGKVGGGIFTVISQVSTTVNFLDGEIGAVEFGLDTFFNGVSFLGPKGLAVSLGYYWVAKPVYFNVAQPLYFYFFPAPIPVPEGYVHPSDVQVPANDWEKMVTDPSIPTIDRYSNGGF